ncbi:hypothetical protein ARMSODRAFT_947595, partial [Armillaria solidipes]
VGLSRVYFPSGAAPVWPPWFLCISFSFLLALLIFFHVASSTICLSLPLSLLGHRSVHLDTFESDSVLRGNSFTDRVATLRPAYRPSIGLDSASCHDSVPRFWYWTNAMPLSLLLV